MILMTNKGTLSIPSEPGFVHEDHVLINLHRIDISPCALCGHSLTIGEMLNQTQGYVHDTCKPNHLPNRKEFIPC